MQESDTVEVEDSISTEDTTQGNLSSDDLLSFIENEPKEEAQSEPVATEKEAETEEEGEDVLLQSESEEDTTDDQEETDEAEPDEPEPPKSVQKLLKQVGKLTARSKTAEERNELLETRLRDLEKQTPEQEKKELEVGNVETFEELEKLRQEALSAKKWARKHEGEPFIEENGTEFTAEQIKEIRDNAEDYIDELIPERAKFLTEKHQSDQLATDTFSFIGDQESPGYELLQKVMADEKFAVLDSLPNSVYIKSLIVEGAQVVQGRTTKSGKAKTEKPSPPSSPVSDVQPPATASKKNTRKVLGAENVSEDQLVAFLSQS